MQFSSRMVETSRLKCKIEESKTWSRLLRSPQLLENRLLRRRLPRKWRRRGSEKDWLVWAKAFDKELERRIPRQLNTYDFADPLPTDMPTRYALSLKDKTNQYGALDRHKCRLSIHGDGMRPEIDFEETRTASHMLS